MTDGRCDAYAVADRLGSADDGEHVQQARHPPLTDSERAEAQAEAGLSMPRGLRLGAVPRYPQICKNTRP
jgi:hypothetical protein